MRTLALASTLCFCTCLCSAPVPREKQEKQEVPQLVGAWRCSWGSFLGVVTLHDDGSYEWVGDVCGEWIGKWDQTVNELSIRERQKHSEGDYHHQWRVSLRQINGGWEGKTAGGVFVRIDRLRGL